MTAHTPTELHAVARRATAAPHEVLTLRLGAEEYGVDIMLVQEIRSFERPTRIAGAPRHVLGVTNLRGVIVPIVDLRSRLGLEAAFDGGTVTVVLAVGGRTVGVVVDAVCDVAALTSDHIRPAPEFHGASDTGHVIGIAAFGEGHGARMLILLDIEGLLAGTAIGPVGPALH